MRITENRVWILLATEQNDYGAVLLEPCRSHNSPMHALNLRRLDNTSLLSIDLEFHQLVVTRIWIENDPDHGSSTLLVGDDNDSFRVPRQRSDLCAYPEVLV